MSKYAPTREDGKKPYVVTLNSWGRERTNIGYGTTPAEAKSDAHGRLGVGDYVVKCRRATPSDLETYYDER